MMQSSKVTLPWEGLKAITQEVGAQVEPVNPLSSRDDSGGPRRLMWATIFWVENFRG